MVGCASTPTEADPQVLAIKEEAIVALRTEFLRRLGETDTQAGQDKWRTYFEEFRPIKAEWEADRWVRKYHQDISNYYSEKFANNWRQEVQIEGYGAKGRAATPLIKSHMHDVLVNFVVVYADYFRKGSNKKDGELVED